jgi:hemerythrin-like domain-containing protein
MTQRSATEILEDEHRIIHKVVGVMAVLAEEIEAGRDVETAILQDIVEFMRTFADKCHHGKEEARLFPALEKAGVPQRGCPIGALIRDHQVGRTLVAGLAEATEAYGVDGPSARASLKERLRELTGLYPNHIWREDYLLFPMTNKVLGPDAQMELLEQFDQVEAMVGEDVHYHFEKLAEELEARTLGS